MRKSKKVLSALVTATMMTAMLAGCTAEPKEEAVTTEAKTEEATETATEETAGIDLAKYEEKLAQDMIGSHLEYDGPTEEAIAPEGKKLAVIMSTATHQGQYVPAEGVKEAAEAVGWECELYDGKGDPAEYNKLINQVCESGVDAIVTVAMDPAVIQNGLQTADELEIPVVGCSQAIDTPNPVKEFDGLGYTFEVAPDMQEVGKMVGNWIVVDSAGEAVVQSFVDLEFDMNTNFIAGVHEVLAEVPTITEKEDLTFMAMELETKLGPMTVSALQQDPEIDYMVVTYDPAAAAQVAAINQAGLQDQAKLASCVGNQLNIEEYVNKDNVQYCDAAWDDTYMGYATVDQLIRLFNGQELNNPHGSNVPYCLIIKENVTDDIVNGWKAPFEYKSIFLGLWGVE